MKTAILRHKVADFNKWKTVYDADKVNREKAGLKEQWVKRNEKDPSEVVMCFDVADQKHAEGYTQSPELQAQMKNGGVIGKPELIFLN